MNFLGGKKKESAEDHAWILQTIIEKNFKQNKHTKILITDVQKAFDHAWRTKVIHNLATHGIKEKILKAIYKINNNLTAKIKVDDEKSEEFEVEYSIRQGSGLSAVLYGQHAGTIIEELEGKKWEQS